MTLRSFFGYYLRFEASLHDTAELFWLLQLKLRPAASLGSHHPSSHAGEVNPP